MTNFYKITAQHKTMYFFGTVHVERFSDLPQNWLQQLQTFNPSYAFFEKVAEPVLQDAAAALPAEPQACTSAKALDDLTINGEVASATQAHEPAPIDQLSKFEKAFYAVDRAISTGNLRAIELREQLAAIYKKATEDPALCLPQEIENQPYLILRDLSKLTLPKEIEAELGDYIKFYRELRSYDKKDLVEKVMLRAYLFSNRPDVELDYAIKVYISHTFPNCKIQGLETTEEFEQSGAFIWAEDFGGVEYKDDGSIVFMNKEDGRYENLTSLGKDIIPSTVTWMLEPDKYVPFKTLTIRNEEEIAEIENNESYLERIDIWKPKLTAAVTEEDSKVTCFAGDDHMVGKDGLLHIFSTLLGGDVHIVDTKGHEFAFNPLTGIIGAELPEQHAEHGSCCVIG